MGTITIRNVDDALKAELRMTAARNHRSMEEEVRQILKKFLLQKRCSEGIGTRISKKFSDVGGVILPKIQRSEPRLFTDNAFDGE